MAKITRIKASDGPTKPEAQDEPTITREKVVVQDKKTEKAKKKEQKKAKKAEKRENNKKVFILFRPFVALGRYLRDSWKEIRQVRWPNRKATWKMVFAVFVYTAFFMVIILLLDLFFRFIFGLILGN